MHFNFLLKICFPKQLQESAANSKSKNESHMAELGRRQEEGSKDVPVNPLGPAAHLCCLQAFKDPSTHVYPRTIKSGLLWARGQRREVSHAYEFPRQLESTVLTG